MQFICPNVTNSRNKLRGFTLVESLLVLLVVSIFIFLPVVAMNQYQAHFQVWGFCARLERGLANAQQTAIIDERETRATYSSSPVPTIYFHSTITGEMKLEAIEVPSQLSVKAFPALTFSSQSGNYTQMKLLEFIWLDQQKQITYKFLFGSGRYDKIIE
jgi:competence protein ComGD